MSEVVGSADHPVGHGLERISQGETLESQKDPVLETDADFRKEDL